MKLHRLALHLICALRHPSHWRFHLAGIVREFHLSPLTPHPARP